MTSGERVRLANARRRATRAPLPDERFYVYVCLKEEMARRGLDLPVLAPAWSRGFWTKCRKYAPSRGTSMLKTGTR